MTGTDDWIAQQVARFSAEDLARAGRLLASLHQAAELEPHD